MAGVSDGVGSMAGVSDGVCSMAGVMVWAPWLV